MQPMTTKHPFLRRNVLLFQGLIRLPLFLAKAPVRQVGSMVRFGHRRRSGTWPHR